MSTKRSKPVPIADLQTNLFVRQALDEDRVTALAELIEAGVTLDPIEITPDMRVINGRHRIEAHGLCLRKEIEAVTVEVRNEIELISLAYKANVGGALPPTTEDTAHTVALLLERGETKKRIGELLNLPASLARKYVDSVQSKMNRAKLLRAASAVTDGGLTMAKAAETHGVDPDKLKEILSGRRKNQKQNGVADIKRAFTGTFKSVSQKNAHALRHILQMYEDGDMTEKQVRELIAHLENLQRQSAHSVADWKKRLDALTRPTAKKAAA